MAKDQNLVLNPQKVSGVCGRLLCCLTYENKVYREAAQGMPRVGRRVTTPDGTGRIRDRDVLKRIVRVQLEEETILREYPLDQIGTKNQSDETGRAPSAKAEEENETGDDVPADEVLDQEMLEEAWPPDDSDDAP
jgi:cell fate regulator YaaT (PSP1 superfamily)